jgi:ectoine hydroxylase-related dioxygenase (phytanoyl-CoA dioxygenase family)
MITSLFRKSIKPLKLCIPSVPLHRTYTSSTENDIKPSPAFPLESVLNPASTTDAVSLLTKGPGFILYDNLISPDQITYVQNWVSQFVQSQSTTNLDASHVESETGHNRIYGNTAKSQGTRIWNLVNKDPIFEQLVQLPQIMEIGDRLLGSGFCLGSFAANHLGPGVLGQHPHLDYPYWDYNDGAGAGAGEWPASPKSGEGHGFFMNLQIAIMVDDFTWENGATEVLPYSQREIKWPVGEEFREGKVSVVGKKGSVLVFTGLLHHAAGTNNSEKNRTSILAQY